jgi:hypothetical protein
VLDEVRVPRRQRQTRQHAATHESLTGRGRPRRTPPACNSPSVTNEIHTSAPTSYASSAVWSCRSKLSDATPVSRTTNPPVSRDRYDAKQ